MRDNLEAAVNSGINLANFAADSIYWQIRNGSATTNGAPDRIIVGYKDDALDPLTGKDNRPGDRTIPATAGKQGGADPFRVNVGWRF